MFRPPRIELVLLILVLALSACSAPANTANPPTVSIQPEVSTAADISGKLIVYSGRSEPLLQPVLDAFKSRYPQVEILLKTGSNSEIANALLEEKSNPQADVFVTTELFTAQSLAQQDVFQAYRPANADQLPAELLGPDNLWTGLSLRARVIMYNAELVSTEDLPTSLLELTDPKWKGQIAAAGSTNGSMQAQIAAMRQLLGEAATAEWINGLLANEVTFFGGHTDVRKAVGAGEFKLGLVNHYYYHLQQAEGSNVGIIYPDQGEGQMGLLTNVTSVAIIKGSGNTTAAQAFVDFLASTEGQSLFAEQNYEYPILPEVVLREGVQPLGEFRRANVDVVAAALDFDATFELIESLGLP